VVTVDESRLNSETHHGGHEEGRCCGGRVAGPLHGILLGVEVAGTQLNEARLILAFDHHSWKL